jgi:S1-C subfamily serine protease
MELTEEEGSLHVVKVLEKSPAAQGGIKVGDVLLKLNRHDVGTMKDALMAVEQLQPDDPLSVQLRRGPGRINLSVQMGQGF